MSSLRTEIEMKAGAANSAKFAAMPVRRGRSEPWDHGTVPVYRPADGAGSQERRKINTRLPGSIGKAVDLFANAPKRFWGQR